MDRSYRKAFAEDIRQAMPFLFAEYGGKPAPCPRPEAHDRAKSYVCIATATLLFEFSDWHGESKSIRVAPLFAPNDMFDLLDALQAVDPSAQPALPLDLASWREAARLLEPRFGRLEKSFSQEEFDDTRREIAHVNRSVNR
jgi:hypothetical protein